LLNPGQRSSLALQSQLIEESRRYNGLDLPPEISRPIQLLKISNRGAAPRRPGQATPADQLATKPTVNTARASIARRQERRRLPQLDQLEQIIDHSRDPQALADGLGRPDSVGKPMKQDYAKLAQLMNEARWNWATRMPGACARRLRHDAGAVLQARPAPVEPRWSHVRAAAIPCSPVHRALVHQLRQLGVSLLHRFAHAVPAGPASGGGASACGSRE